jgi:hypothetical protein
MIGWIRSFILIFEHLPVRLGIRNVVMYSCAFFILSNSRLVHNIIFVRTTYFIYLLRYIDSKDLKRGYRHAVFLVLETQRVEFHLRVRAREKLHFKN